MVEVIFNAIWWFLALLSPLVLTIVALGVVGVAIISNVIALVVCLRARKKHGCCTKREMRKTVKRVNAFLAWVYLGIAVMMSLYVMRSDILLGGLWIMNESIILAIVVVILVYIINFLFFCCHGKGKSEVKSSCNCGGKCSKNTKEITRETKQSETVEKEVEMPKFDNNIGDGIVWKNADKSVMRDTNKEAAAALAQRRATMKELEEKKEKAAPKKKPVAKKSVAKKSSMQVKKSEVKPVSPAVADRTKPMFESVTVVPGTRTVETVKTQSSSRQVTASTASTSATYSATELRAKKESMKVEYARLEKKLDEIRSEKLKEIGTSPNTTQSASLPSYMRPPGGSPYHGNTQPKSTAQRYDEQEVRQSLFGLKAAMDTLQKQIDSHGDK